MSYLPQSNARLLSIVGPGLSEDGSLPATQGTAKWTGDVDAYMTEKIRTTLASGPGAMEKHKDTTLIVPADLTPPVVIKTGDTVVYSYADGTHRRRIQDFEAHHFEGVNETVRLHLQDVALPLPVSELG